MHYSLPVLPDKDVQIYVVGHHFMTKIIPRALVEILLLVRSVSDPEQSWIGSFFFSFFFLFFFFLRGRESSINHLSIKGPFGFLGMDQEQFPLLKISTNL
jgi:hypothetical protein